MEKQDVINYLNRIARERGYGKCLISRFEHFILPQFPSLSDFAKADKHAIHKAYAATLANEDASKAYKRAPYIGTKLLNLCDDARAYIINGRLEEKKEKAAEEERKNFEIMIERKRNPVFTIKALKSVIALAELAGAETVNLDQIFSVCDAFGVSLDTAGQTVAS